MKGSKWSETQPGRHNTRRPRGPDDWPRRISVASAGAGVGKSSQCSRPPHRPLPFSLKQNRCCCWVSVMPSINNNRAEAAGARTTRHRVSFLPISRNRIWHERASTCVKTPLIHLFLDSCELSLDFLRNIWCYRSFTSLKADRQSPGSASCTYSSRSSICSGGRGLLVNTNRIPSARTPSPRIDAPVSVVQRWALAFFILSFRVVMCNTACSFCHGSSIVEEECRPWITPGFF